MPLDSMVSDNVYRLGVADVAGRVFDVAGRVFDKVGLVFATLRQRF